MKSSVFYVSTLAPVTPDIAVGCLSLPNIALPDRRQAGELP
jgi:hypothetical protein